MKNLVDRRGVLIGGLALGLFPLTKARAGDGAAISPGPGPSFPSQDPELVREVVGASHGRLDRVRELVTSRPELAKAAVDWGFGDWETALGAASHTGQREIAEILIDHGARPDLFTFAMMGELAAVRAMIEARPGIQSIPGPHGITLLSHARFGGEPARPVVEYLESVGGADPQPIDLPLAPELRDRYLGRYRIGPGQDLLEVHIGFRDKLSIRKVDGMGRVLLHQGDHHFQPVGAPSVGIHFETTESGVRSLTIHEGDLQLIAEKV